MAIRLSCWSLMALPTLPTSARGGIHLPGRGPHGFGDLAQAHREVEGEVMERRDVSIRAAPAGGDNPLRPSWAGDMSPGTPIATEKAVPLAKQPSARLGSKK